MDPVYRSDTFRFKSNVGGAIFIFLKIYYLKELQRERVFIRISRMVAGIRAFGLSSAGFPSTLLGGWIGAVRTQTSTHMECRCNT